VERFDRPAPALIARCAGVADVIEAVRFARTHQLLVAVRGGGHSYPGYGVCDGGMVIELSLMKGIRVDPDARTVRAQAGVLLRELDRETQFGFAVPAGFISHTGMAGLTLGGGIGFTMRKLGLTIDNLISVNVVTAEGEFVKASEQENDDLSGVFAEEAATSGSRRSSSLIERKAEAAPPPRATAGAGTGTGGQDVDLRPPLRTLQALNVEGL
jgi:FAD/FMN-containing dehydrogenase